MARSGCWRGGAVGRPPGAAGGARGTRGGPRWGCAPGWRGRRGGGRGAGPPGARPGGRRGARRVLWAGWGGAGAEAMGAGLVARGADRVIAMLAPVTDRYATVLARRLYQELAARPGRTAGQALARAGSWPRKTSRTAA